MINLIPSAPSTVYFDFGHALLKSLRGEEAMTWSLEREPDGRLTSACKGRLVGQLKEYVVRKEWESRPTAICTVGGRGVSLRRLSFPTVSDLEFQNLLELKIESEFPLSPAELVWGYLAIKGVSTEQGGLAAREWLVAVVRKDSIEEYREIMTAAGMTPLFTLASLARNVLCESAHGSYAVLEIGRGYSELMGFEEGIPTFIRLIPWEASPSPESMNRFTAALQKQWLGSHLYLFGEMEIAAYLTNLWREQRLTWNTEIVQTNNQPSSLVGLRKYTASQGPTVPLLLRMKTIKSPARFGFGKVVLTEWMFKVMILALVALMWPFMEAFLVKPIVSLQVAHFVSKAQPVENILGKEFTFLQGLKQSQPPYLELLYLFSDAAPPGSHFDSISMDRRGEIQLRCTMGFGDQVEQFRSKLIASGFFSSLSVDEQVPTPNRQRASLRMTLQVKPWAKLPLRTLGPRVKELPVVPALSSPKPSENGNS